MQLEVLSESHVRLLADGDDGGLEVQGEPFGPLQMLAASLALCTAAVMQEYATTAQFHLHRYAVDVRWSYAERPYRVEAMQLRLEVGPEVPPSRQQALLRAADQCTVHNSLQRGVRIVTSLEVPHVAQA